MTVTVLLAVDPPADGANLDLGSSPRSLLLFWFSLLTIGQIGVFALLCTTVFGKSVSQKRLASHKNFLMFTFLSPFATLLLFYSGHYLEAEPPYSICLAQASLKHGFDAAFISSTLVMIFETWRVVKHGMPTTISTARTITACFIPYFCFIVLALPVAIIGIEQPDQIYRLPDAFYCSINNVPMTSVAQVVMTLLAAGLFICEGTLGFLLVVIYNHTKSVQKCTEIRCSQPITWQMSLFIRSALILFYEAVAMYLISGMSQSDHFVSSFFLSSYELAVFIVFATQRDIMHAWAFWRRPEPEMDDVSVDGSATLAPSFAHERA
ncbi:hypothetical protein SISNIDRAFT_489129 [Sistotremastrum niveocremeum HHB9708]|uniref:G-protein coupled receptors family 1 profile domain-containing protein n=1 Tax=Sistotremastrum niveocremeum HHB9708 TaxID=1314777 RepID=A0A164Q919_9AGAM|nr:hypothetical protein SISNIDRAFT_489129 [Sistotremastrum niveocremeum HHB9708]